jgi:hypothetical protein
MDGGQYGGQGRAAAEGNAGGPSMTPFRGGHDKRDVLIAVAIVAALVIGVIVLLV